MCLFVGVDLLEIVVEWIRIAGSDELGLGEVGKAFLIELALQILQGQGIVEDYDKEACQPMDLLCCKMDLRGGHTDGVVDLRRRDALLNRRGIAKTSSQKDCDSVGEEHLDGCELDVDVQ